MMTLLKKSHLPSLYQREVIPSLAKRGEGRFESGFTLIELLITMVVFVLVIAAASQIFTGLLTQFKQQSKIAETNIEGIIGLDMLRRDIEHAGYGLPWVIPVTVNYSEAPAGSGYDGYNDSPSSSPRALLNGDNIGYNGSDELIIKAVNVSRGIAASKWTHLSASNVLKDWDVGYENLIATDNIIVLSPGVSEATRRTLVVSSASSSTWNTTYNSTSNFDPDDATETRFVYGVDSAGILMPFNRADYFILGPANINVPDRCAENTGVLLKSVISQADGSRFDNLPIFDCVADMQVIFGRDTDSDGDVDSYTDNFFDPSFNPLLVASDIRNQLVEVRIYILAHEGQRDVNYTYPNNPVRVGEVGIGGRDFNFTTVASPITNWQDYRWKVYTLVIKPNNLE